MTHSYSRSSQLTMAGNDKDQAFSDVIAAISEGKYSWACVLMLRSAGYNPLHYMPYRTYNRIIKANLNLGGNRATKKTSKSTASQSKIPTQQSIASGYPVSNGSKQGQKPAPTISDLPHLDPAAESKSTISGGSGSGGSTPTSAQASASWWKNLIHPTWQ